MKKESRLKLLISLLVVILIVLSGVVLGVYFMKGRNDTHDIIAALPRTNEFVPIDDTIPIPPVDDSPKIADTPPVVPPVAKPDTAPANTVPPPVGNTNWWNYPEEILIADTSGDPFTIVVNKKYRLPSDYIPTDLTTIPHDKVRTVGTDQLKKQAVDALVKLVTQARSEGIDLSVASSYRSYQKQKDVYNYYLKKYKYNYDYIDKFSARPGHSQHQLGTTVDFSTSSVGDKVGDAFNTTEAAKWLSNNAKKFGFYMSYPEGSEQITGYKYEGWHYRYYPDGKP